MEKNTKQKTDIEKLMSEKITDAELLKMFDLRCNLYFIFEYMYKNKITDEKIIKKSWEIIENNNDKLVGGGYYVWQLGDVYLFKLTGQHSKRYSLDEEGKRVIDWMLSFNL